MRRIPKRRADLGICALACLVIAGPVAMAEGSFDGDYIGKRVLTKGPADNCPAEENVSVTIDGNVLHFTNSQLQNYAIGFYPEPDGTFTISHEDADGNSTEIQGRIVKGVIDADVDNPPCLHHWRLKKK